MKVREESEKAGLINIQKTKIMPSGPIISRQGKVKVKVAHFWASKELCPTLCDPTDSTVHGIL